MATHDISRADALALLAEQNIDEIIQNAAQGSAAISTFRLLQMGRKIARLPVLSALPTAGFVDESATEDSGVKPTAKVAWENKYLNAEEIAVIVPIHENILEDSDFDIFGEIQPLIEQEFGRVLDAAVFFGENIPESWGDALVPAAIAAGRTVEAGTGRDMAEDFNLLFGEVEESGFDVNQAYTGTFLRKDLRGLRDEVGNPIFVSSLSSDGTVNSVYGEDLTFVRNGAWDKTQALAVAGDASKAILGIREDVQVKFLDQATVGGINLAERDMVALRFKFRVAFQTAVPVTGDQEEDAYPFAVMLPKP